MTNQFIIVKKVIHKKYVDYFQRISVRNFQTRTEAFEYLEREVFLLPDFQANVQETADALKISYMIAFEIIANYLTDVLYELDQAQAQKKNRTKINVFGYFFLQVGFMRSLENKKMFLEKLIFKSKCNDTSK